MSWEQVSLRSLMKGQLLKTTTARSGIASLLSLKQPYSTGNSNHDDTNKEQGVATIGEKSDENVVLADALNLLSPKPVERSSSSYKPSLLTHLTSGPLHEQVEFSETNINRVLTDKLPSDPNNRTSVKEHLDHLLAGLNFVTDSLTSSSTTNATTPHRNGSTGPSALAEDIIGPDLLSYSQKDLSTYIKKLKSERALTKVFELFYYNNELTSKIVIDIVLNKHMVNLNKLPVQVETLLSTRTPQPQLNSFSKWSKIDFIHLKIILLKKYHDLKKPLLIVRNLKENFQTSYLPIIEGGNELSPFYERIIWKFYFEYLSKDEQYYIQKLNRLSSTILIWESSLPKKSTELIDSAFEFHRQDLNALQTAFFKLCTSKLTKSLIEEELSHSQNVSSKTLSHLKQLSIKYKIYTFPPGGENRVPLAFDVKSNLYLFVNALESMILDEFVTKQGEVDSDSIIEIMELFKEIKIYKEVELMKIKEGEINEEWLTINGTSGTTY